MVTEPQALKGKALVPDLWFPLQIFPMLKLTGLSVIELLLTPRDQDQESEISPYTTPVM